MPDDDAVRPKWAPVRLPKVGVDWVKKWAPCPVCGRLSVRHSTGKRLVRDVGRVLDVRYSKHRCESCRRVFSHYDGAVVGKGKCYRVEFERLIVRVVRNGKTCEAVSRAFDVPAATLADWVRDARNERMSPVSAVSGGV